MNSPDLLAVNRNRIMEIAARHGVRRIRVFGSFARGQAGPQSDVDFLVEVAGPTPPWFPGGLVAELEALLGRPVEVIEPEALAPAIQEHVLAEAVPL